MAFRVMQEEKVDCSVIEVQSLFSSFFISHSRSVSVAEQMPRTCYLQLLCVAFALSTTITPNFLVKLSSKLRGKKLELRRLHIYLSIVKKLSPRLILSPVFQWCVLPQRNLRKTLSRKSPRQIRFWLSDFDRFPHSYLLGDRLLCSRLECLSCPRTPY